MLSSDAMVRMRSAYVIEKVSRVHPELLRPFKKLLIDQISQMEQPELRWHVAQLFSYLELNEGERKDITRMLFLWIDYSRSKIVIVNSMQTLADFAERDWNLRPMIINELEDIASSGSPAVVSRGKEFLKKLRRINKS